MSLSIEYSIKFNYYEICHLLKKLEFYSSSEILKILIQ